MVLIFPSFAKDLNIQMQEAGQTPNRINPNKFMPRHIIVKLLKTKVKKEILKAVTNKHLTYRGKMINNLNDNAVRNPGGQKEVAHHFFFFLNVERKRNCQLKILYAWKIPFRNKGQKPF